MDERPAVWIGHAVLQVSDLMVDDVEATHEQWTARGLNPSAIEHGRIHSAFTVHDPDGHLVRVNSTHVIGPV